MLELLGQTSCCPFMITPLVSKGYLKVELRWAQSLLDSSCCQQKLMVYERRCPHYYLTAWSKLDLLKFGKNRSAGKEDQQSCLWQSIRFLPPSLRCYFSDSFPPFLSKESKDQPYCENSMASTWSQPVFPNLAHAQTHWIVFLLLLSLSCSNHLHK